MRPVFSAQGQFLMSFLDSPSKKVQSWKFSWRMALQNSRYENFIRYEKFKMANFWKKALKLPKFQKSISQEPFRVRWKNFVSYKLEHMSKIWSKSKSMGDMAVPHWHGITLMNILDRWIIRFQGYFRMWM